MNRADSLMSQGKLDEAIAVLNELAKKDPKPFGLEARLGKAYYKNRKLQLAVPHFQMALQQNPDDVESTQLLALSYYALGNFQQALPLLLRFKAHVPQGEVDSPYLLGICYLKTQQWENARRAFAEMFSTPPDSPLAHLMLAKMMVGQRLEDRSVPEIQKALELDPRLPMAHFLLGEIYVYRLNPQLAVDEFKRELEINPTVWLVYWRLGDAYARLGKYEEAEKVLKQAIWLNEASTGPYILLGQIELKKGDLELAVGFLEHALKLDPQNYFAHYSLAKAYQQLGRTDEANRHFELMQSLRHDKKDSEDRFFQDLTP
jgi:tetratricopeptide (TPR) repeat protein